MSSVEEKIDNLRSELSDVKLQRYQARDRFIKDQATYADRQCFFLEQIGRLSEIDISNLAQYARIIESISSFDESLHVINKEAEVCQALHQVEVTTNQLRVLLKYHAATVEFLEDSLAKESQEKNLVLQTLERKIEVASDEIGSSVLTNQASLTKQRHELSVLRGEYQIEDELHVLLCTSLDHRGMRKQTRRMSMEKAIARVSSLFGIYQTAEAA